jgi:hypothetical protein
MYLRLFICVFLYGITCGAVAETAGTARTPLFSNERVSAWKTIIYPSGQQKLTLHRHEHDRVVVAFDNAKIKVVDNQGHTHYMTWIKGEAYYLKKDIPGETHTDENISNHPVTVCVIELKS